MAQSLTAGARRVLAVPTVVPRPLAAVVLIGVAYHQSLISLVGGVYEQGAVAYAAVVPLTALVLAWLLVANAPAHLPIHDRQTDYIVGVALLASGLAIALLTAGSLGPRFWESRIDLLTLPITAGGIVAILFGVRRLWTIRWALAYLFLAWPGVSRPLADAVEHAARGVADVVLAATASLLPVATRVIEAPEGMFAVSHAGGVALVSAGAEWSGAGVLLGFLFVGLAVAAGAEGRRLRRFLWLTSGLAGAWILALIAVQVDLALAAASGVDSALVAREPMAGAAVLMLAVALALLLGRVAGFRLLPREGAQRTGTAPRMRRVRAMAVVIGTAAILGWLNAGYPAMAAASDQAADESSVDRTVSEREIGS